MAIHIDMTHVCNVCKTDASTNHVHLQCDNCGKTSDFHSHAARYARASGRDDGWIHKRNLGAAYSPDFCPECAAKKVWEQ